MTLVSKTIISKLYLFLLRCCCYLTPGMYVLPLKTVDIENYQFFLIGRGRNKSTKLLEKLVSVCQNITPYKII